MLMRPFPPPLERTGYDSIASPDLLKKIPVFLGVPRYHMRPRPWGGRAGARGDVILLNEFVTEHKNKETEHASIIL
jgi:hypothetical protein